ncbi:hypothetical protein [Pseudomonas mosselii]|uniref:Uncharacterized protein n=1 Tax=Pseudomonas mosselii TaxID=78327 RepID=A0A7W2K065_9PSED|nr:hypothetical protein [Pseudomonas mosselii]MBA6068357.1 hypothetical protein [Pseudomonas mosselii]
MPTEKPFVFTKTFDQEGTFQALYAAQNWLRENGYSYGSTCRDQPIGVMKGEWDIAKWRNLSRQDIAGLDGVLFGSPCNGPIELKLKEVPA